MFFRGGQERARKSKDGQERADRARKGRKGRKSRKGKEGEKGKRGKAIVEKWKGWEIEEADRKNLLNAGRK